MTQPPIVQLCLPCYDKRENGILVENCQCHSPQHAENKIQNTQASLSYSMNLGFITDPATRCIVCNGNIALKQDIYGKYEECLMCGTIVNDSCS